MKGIILIGAPGSGKGTQGLRLASALKYIKVAPGDILRSLRSEAGSDLAVQVNSMLDSGKLLPDDIINSVTMDFILSRAAQFSGIIFDGYPRSIAQAEYLSNDIASKFSIIDMKAIFLRIDEDALIERLIHRFTCKDCGAIFNKKTKPTQKDGICDECGSSNFALRTDDSEIAIVKTRFAEFHAKTESVINYYRNKNILYDIDVSGNENDIYTNLMQIIAYAA